MVKSEQMGTPQCTLIICVNIVRTSAVGFCCESSMPAHTETGRIRTLLENLEFKDAQLATKEVEIQRLRDAQMARFVGSSEENVLLLKKASPLTAALQQERGAVLSTDHNQRQGSRGAPRPCRHGW